MLKEGQEVIREGEKMRKTRVGREEQCKRRRKVGKGRRELRGERDSQ